MSEDRQIQQPRREPETAKQLVGKLRKLKLARKKRHLRARTERNRRRALTTKQRAQVLAKTARRCHICGGKIDGT